MTYNATYDTDDVAPVVIDGGLTILVAVIGFATIFGLILVYNMIRGKGFTLNARKK